MSERTYVRRHGRATLAQTRALAAHFATYRVGGEGLIDVDALFGRHGPLVVEIGFGMGHGLLAYATAHPDANCLGAEVYRPGIGALVAALERDGIGNVRIFEGDARVLLRERLPAHCIDTALIYFPDPWPKKRHWKRRLVDPAFVALLASRMKSSGRVLLATDWADYAAQMLAVLEAEPAFVNEAGPGCYAARPPERPLTRFEARGLRLGHAVRDLAFRRRQTNSATTESR